MYATSFDRVSNHAEISNSPVIRPFEPATTKSECRETTVFRQISKPLRERPSVNFIRNIVRYGFRPQCANLVA